MIHPEIQREGAEVWVKCPQCLGEGTRESHCSVCDDVGTMPMADAVAAAKAFRTHQVFHRRGLEPVT